MNRYDLVKQWVKERDEAAQSFDVEKFKAFHEKWAKLGIYDKRIKLPPDSVIEITMRKMTCNIQNPNPKKLEEARQWLEDRGYTAEIFPL